MDRKSDRQTFNKQTAKDNNRQKKNIYIYLRYEIIISFHISKSTVSLERDEGAREPPTLGSRHSTLRRVCVGVAVPWWRKEGDGGKQREGKKVRVGVREKEREV